MTRYDEIYYSYNRAGATRSAGVVLPLLLETFSIQSVADFGCGQGAWLAVWRKLGVSDVVGVDGHYVDPGSLLIPPSCFKAADLQGAVTLGRTFDLVQSLEVAEHLPESCAATFVETLTSHSRLVLFSAAPPGQGGDYHVNEQPYVFWKRLFAERDYTMIDVIRPRLRRDKRVEAWYRYNTFVFARRDLLHTFAHRMSANIIPDSADVPDVSPLAYRLRKRLVRLIPVKVATACAVLKKHWYVMRYPASRSGAL
jgi:SAM-dependent methyltransferase